MPTYFFVVLAVAVSILLWVLWPVLAWPRCPRCGMAPVCRYRWYGEREYVYWCVCGFRWEEKSNVSS